MNRWASTVFIVIAATMLAGCAVGGDSGEDATAPPGDSTPTAQPAPEDRSEEGVPDACGLLTPDELSGLVGSDVGEGLPQSASPDRSICLFLDSGLILAIEIGTNYEASRQIIDESGRATEDLAGVGTEAFYDPAGQVVALGDAYFVGVTGGGDVEVQKQIASLMLEAAGDG